MSLSLSGLPLLHTEVLWGESPRPRQSALQEPDQTGQRGDGGAPQAQAWLDLESVLCFRRTHGTRSTVCWKGRIFIELPATVKKKRSLDPREVAFQQLTWHIFFPSSCLLRNGLQPERAVLLR